MKNLVGKIQDRLPRAEIVRQVHPLRLAGGGPLGRSPKPLEKDFRPALAEGVDALLDVADDKDIVVPPNAVEDRLLDGVDILVFVDEDIPKTVAKDAGDFLVRMEHVQRQVFEIGKVQGVALPLGRRV